MNETAMTQELETVSAFNPVMHGFVFLSEHRPPWGGKYYEYRNHACVDGNHDFHRLNLELDGPKAQRHSSLGHRPRLWTAQTFKG